MRSGSAIAAFVSRFSRIIFFLIGIGVVVPLVIGMLTGIPASMAFSFILSAYVFQAAAPPVGLVLGIPAPLILVMLACFAAGVVFGIQEICMTLGERSERVASFIGKIRKKTEEYPLIEKYGPVTCILIAWIPGISLYGTPVIAWLLGWKRLPSVIFTTAGFLTAAVFVLFFANRINEVLWFAGIAGLIIAAITLPVSTGLSLDISRAFSAAREARSVLPLFAANFILVPVTCYFLATGLGLPDSAAAGLILIAAAAGAPLSFGLLDRGGGVLTRCAPLTTILGLGTVLFLPLVLTASLTDREVPTGHIAAYMILFFLVPLGTALCFRSHRKDVAVRWALPLEKISWVALSAAIIALFALFSTTFLHLLGTSSLLAAVILVVVACAGGCVLGGFDPARRMAFAQVTSERNLVIALVMAVMVFSELEMMALVVITGLIGLLPLGVNQIIARKKRAPSLPDAPQP